MPYTFRSVLLKEIGKHPIENTLNAHPCRAKILVACYCSGMLCSHVRALVRGHIATWMHLTNIIQEGIIHGGLDKHDSICMKFKKEEKVQGSLYSITEKRGTGEHVHHHRRGTGECVHNKTQGTLQRSEKEKKEDGASA